MPTLGGEGVLKIYERASWGTFKISRGFHTKVKGDFPHCMITLLNSTPAESSSSNVHYFCTIDP